MKENQMGRSTRWRSPVANHGGITGMIQHHVRLQWPCGKSPNHAGSESIIVHAYREVGTSLEAVVEVHIPKSPFGTFIKMGTIVI